MSIAKKPLPDLLNSPLPNDLYEMELLGERRFSAAVPVWTSAELKKRILGAIKSYYGNLASIDYTIKRYGDRWEFGDATDSQRFVVDALKCIDQEVATLSEAIMQGRPRPDSAGLLAAEVALVRLKSSFRSALILISQAHAFEAAAIVRLILEQVAWSYAVHGCDDGDEIRRIRPTKSVSHLKRLNPVAGPLYGALSSRAHIEPETAKAYYTADSEGTIEIRHQLSTESYLVLGYLLGVLGLFRQVILRALGDYLEVSPEENLGHGRPALKDRLTEILRRLKATHPPLDFVPLSILDEVPPTEETGSGLLPK